MSHTASAFAPASVGNVAVGFDILGHSIAGAGDRVTVTRTSRREVRITSITNAGRLPREASLNTAGVALMSLRDVLSLDHGFDIALEKGIPFGSGMGGSAASAVAALIAANALLDEPLPREDLYRHAIAGEAIASGGAHGDNVGPMLLGGLVLATAERIVPIDVPGEWHATIVHPHTVLETRESRSVLAGSYELHQFVEQSANLALVLAGCMKGDAALVREGLRDVLVEPRRAFLIPGFAAVKAAALAHDALGASISGGGPSIFAWFVSEMDAKTGAAAMERAFVEQGIGCDAFISPVRGPRAEVIG